jgi:monothiol glutaredoxin
LVFDENRIPNGFPHRPIFFLEVNTMDTQEIIKEQVNAHPVVLYMKGSPRTPMCGFSATAVQILRACNLPLFFSVDVLEEPEIREGIKVFSDWPTIPQLYVRGTFIGGCDIMREMYESGELQQLLVGLAAPE